MPRIYTSASDPIDYCLKCFPSERVAIHNFGNVGNGPDGRGNCFCYDADHPDYSCEGYTCEKCKRVLTEVDDFID